MSTRIIQTELITPELLESNDGLRQVSDGVHESSSAMSITSTAKSSPIQSPKEKDGLGFNFESQTRPIKIVKDDHDLPEFFGRIEANWNLAMKKHQGHNDDSIDSSPTSVPSGIFPDEDEKHPANDGEQKGKRKHVKKTRSIRNISPFLHLKKLVSKNKKRIHDKNLNVNLDLSYIEDRIIAMGYPADSPVEKLFRNSIDEVQKFLNKYHRGRYMIYNLCSETNRIPSTMLDENQNPGTGYDVLKFNNRVQSFGFKDHCPPNFNLTIEFCKHALDWLNQNEQNVLAVHCKAGKGRTGVMICCLLIYLSGWLGQHYSTTTAEREKLTWTTEQAMQYYAQRRTKDGKGVTIPSQIRFIRYFEAWMRWDLKYVDDFKATFLRLELIDLPQIYKEGLFFEISILQGNRYKCVHSSQFESTEWQILDKNYHRDHNFKPIKTSSRTLPLPTIPCMRYDAREPGKFLTGHVQVEFFKKGQEKKPLFSMYFHTFFQSLPPEYQKQLDRQMETFRIDHDDKGEKFFTPVIYPVPKKGVEEPQTVWKPPLKDDSNVNLSKYIGNQELSKMFPIPAKPSNVEMEPIRSISQHANHEGYGAWIEREGKSYRIHEPNRKWGSTQRTVVLCRDELDQFSKDANMQRKFTEDFKVVLTIQDTKSQVMKQELLINRQGKAHVPEEISRDEIRRREQLENRILHDEICQNESFKRRK